MEAQEKHEKPIFFRVVVLLFCCLLATSCRTTRESARVDGDILEYQRKINELENENRDLASRLERADRELGENQKRIGDIRKIVDDNIRGLETISRSLESGAGEVDEIIRLFAEYQRRVNAMLQDYRKATEDADKARDNNRSL